MMDQHWFQFCLAAVIGAWMNGTKAGHRVKAWCRANGKRVFLAALAFPVALVGYFLALMAWTFWNNGTPW